MLRCTGRAYPPAAIRARPRRPGAARSGTFPDPAYPDSSYYVDVARALHAGHGLQRRLHLDLRRGRRHDPGRPDPADPIERALDAAGVARPGAVPRGLRRPSPGPPRAPFALIGALAAPLTWAIARDAGARPIGRSRAPGSWSRSPLLSTVFMAQPDNFSLYQPLVVGVALDGRPRPRAATRPRVRRWPACSPGSRRSPATTACSSWRRVGLVFLWDRWRVWRVGAARATAAGGIPFAARGRRLPSRSSSCVMAPWWARQLAVFGSLSPSTHVRQGPVHPRHRRVEQHHDAGHPRPPARDGHRAADRDAASAARSPRSMIYLDARLRLSSSSRSMVIGGWARRRSIDFGPFFLYAGDPVRVLGDRVGRPRPGRDVHPFGGRARAVQLHPRARGRSPSSSAGSPRRRPTWDVDAAPRGLRRRAIVFAVVIALARRARPSMPPGRRRRDQARRVAAALDAAGAPATDRVMSIDAAGIELLDRPRRRRPRQRPARHHPRRRARLRHPLARPRARRCGRGRRARSSTAVARPAWLGARRSLAGRARRPSARRLPASRRRAAMTRREAVAVGASASSPWPSSCASSSPRQIVFPKPEDTAYYVGVARNLLEGRGLVSRRPVELRDAAARRSRARRSRSGCRCPTLPRRDPDGDPRRRRSPAAQVVVRRRRGARAGPRPGGSPPTSPRNAGCPWPRPDARPRRRPDRRGLPAAPAPLARCPTRRCRSRSSPSARACS